MRPTEIPSREAEAYAEVARTQVSRGSARILFAGFLILLLSGVAVELQALRGGQPNLLAGESRLAFPSPDELLATFRAEGWLAAATALRDAGVSAEDRLGRDSALAALVRPRFQAWLLRAFRYGNSQVLVGKDDWLFFRDDFDYLTSPPFLSPAALARRSRGASRHPSSAPDPLPAILRLAKEVEARGMGFVLLPVPTKLGVAWERFLGRAASGGEALENPSRDVLLERLSEAGVAVYDPAPALRAMELAGAPPPYMQRDSHWSPAGLDRAASGLASWLRARYPLATEPGFTRRKIPNDRLADLAELLGLDPETNPYLHEPLELDAVDAPGGAPYGTRSGVGEVLLVGDSFSRLLIRNKRRGGDANFAAALAFHLQAPVAMRAEDDAGADFARRIRWLRKPGELDGRVVVVFEIAERSFALGDWTSIPLEEPPRPQ